MVHKYPGNAQVKQSFGVRLLRAGGAGGLRGVQGLGQLQDVAIPVAHGLVLLGGLGESGQV
jgi:hypothetical protein